MPLEWGEDPPKPPSWSQGAKTLYFNSTLCLNTDFAQKNGRFPTFFGSAPHLLLKKKLCSLTYLKIFITVHSAVSAEPALKISAG